VHVLRRVRRQLHTWYSLFYVLVACDTQQRWRCSAEACPHVPQNSSLDMLTRERPMLKQRARSSRSRAPLRVARRASNLNPLQGPGRACSALKRREAAVSRFLPRRRHSAASAPRERAAAAAITAMARLKTISRGRSFWVESQPTVASAREAKPPSEVEYVVCVAGERPPPAGLPPKKGPPYSRASMSAAMELVSW
jgi:hypothetical protein